MGGTRADRTRASIDAIDRQILRIGAERAWLSGDDVARLSAMLGVHSAAVRNARSDMLTIRGPIWRSMEAVSKHLVDRLCPLVLDRFDALLPAGDKHHGHRQPGETSVIDYAETVAAVFAWETSVGKHVLLRAAIKKRLARVAAACVVRIESHLGFENDADIPDFRRLGREILRAEVAEWAFRLAGAPEHSEAIALRAGRVARQSVTWAARVFERFRRDPDELSHFDAVATVAAVDELLLVILHVHESDQVEREAGSHPFVLTIGEQALQDFVAGLSHMTARYLQIAEQNLLEGGAPGAFVMSVLQVLERVLRVERVLQPVLATLGIELDHAATVKRMLAMRSRLLAVLGTPRASRDHAARLEAIDRALPVVGS
ncbi:hypothetical protein GCM10017083_20940 [Thalassobaculum fulvum]|uniref:Uncharacterized protein n=1 Tax=Thalassobaculum fulvum TaxID=1633335 RepID=A0A918XS96_9PROT|nr:hypothetical protein [Thalassobaculum fulvum]GHD49085.1 hypothetical protein GCM10017083_20940 [Thalassobaculum fulvum]